jgi:hypothetical protein
LPRALARAEPCSSRILDCDKSLIAETGVNCAGGADEIVVARYQALPVGHFLNRNAGHLSMLDHDKLVELTGGEQVDGLMAKTGRENSVCAARGSAAKDMAEND